jgi:uncharacterized membrane protein YoaK (UPF0700 family)
MRLRSRDHLVILLALTTGAVDATAFERLGTAFASVITGNLILLGIGAAHGAGRPTLVSGCALAGYAIGVVIASPKEGQQAKHDDDWPPSVTAALLLDLVLLIVLTVGWELADGHPGETAQVLLLALAAAAMGVQSTAIRRLGQISTTYLTSTYIGVFEALAARRWSRAELRSVAILLVALVGAAAAVGLILHAPRLLPVLALAPLVIVILASRGLIAAGPHVQRQTSPTGLRPRSVAGGQMKEQDVT